MRQKYLDIRMEKANEPEADIYIFDSIGEAVDWDGEVHGFGPNKLMQALDTCDALCLNVHINSMGGSVYDGITIYNILKTCGKHVSVTVDGMAASSASIIAMAGDTVKMHKTSQMMIHNCWTFACGNANEFRKLADDMDKVMESSKIVYLEKTNVTPERLDEMLDAETTLSATECLEMGFCDEIIGAEPADPVKDEVQAEIKNEKMPDMPMGKKTHWFF